MQCLKCKHKTVCKHLSYMMENLHIGIEINNCKLYEEESQESSNYKTIDTGVLSVPGLEPEKANTGFTNYADFGKATFSAPINAMPVEINKVTCDRCKKEVYSTEVENCVECGRKVCMDCRVDVFNPETGIPASTCEKCWSGTEDPVPGEESKVSISFEQEKETWDLNDFADGEAIIVGEEEDVTTEPKQVDDKPTNRKSKKK